MMTRYKPWLAVSASALMAISFAGYAYAATAAVKAENQKISGGAVTIADVNLPKNGFLVIHPSDTQGNLIEKDLGHIALKAGDHKNVRVKLTGNHKAGEKLWAMLHEDTGTPGVYQFGTKGKANADMPFKADGKAVEQAFKLL